MTWAARLALTGMLFACAGCGGVGRTDDVGDAGPLRAESVRLSAACERWMGSGVRALICDPEREGGARFEIVAGVQRAIGHARVGVAQLGGRTPLRAGQSVRFELSGGSSQTVAAFVATDGREVHRVVVTPFERPAQWYRATVEQDRVRVVTDTGETRTIQLVSEPNPAVASATVEQTLRSFASLMSGRAAHLARACDLLASSTRAALSRGELSCDGAMAWLVRYDEHGDYPDYEESAVRAVDVEQRAGLTIARVRITHRYAARSASDPSNKTVTAIVPLTREHGGWRILHPGPLLPNSALDGRFDLPPDKLRAQLRAFTAAAAGVDLSEREERAATTVVRRGDLRCSGRRSETDDPARDVRVGNGGYIAKRQQPVNVDAVTATHANKGGTLCYEASFRTALPTRFTLRLGAYQRASGTYATSQLEVTVTGTRAVAVSTGPRGEIARVPARVSVEASRQRLAVQADAARAWPGIDLARRYRWHLNALERAPTIRNAYMELIPDNQRIDGKGNLPSP